MEVLVNNVGGNVGSGLFVDSDPETWAGDVDLSQVFQVDGGTLL